MPPTTSVLDTDGFASILSFLSRQGHNFPSSNVGDNLVILHHYSTHSKQKTAATVNSAVVETIITHL